MLINSKNSMKSIRIHQIQHERSKSVQGPLKILQINYSRAYSPGSNSVVSHRSLRVNTCKFAAKIPRRSESKRDLEIKVMLPEVNMQNISPKRTPKTAEETQEDLHAFKENREKRMRISIPLEMKKLDFDLFSPIERSTSSSWMPGKKLKAGKSHMRSKSTVKCRYEVKNIHLFDRISNSPKKKFLKRNKSFAQYINELRQDSKSSAHLPINPESSFQQYPKSSKTNDDANRTISSSSSQRSFLRHFRSK
ncbi:unnamed protein product [Blepharisma stoltei]|uniref:Uncharacterized protein n=1 Tax=Blepharisma stoltei TaxID=1481888 RepID=A0AAU9JDW6_9CILI|nr:unnamed protein product [Blepharisma stoltei]